MGEGSRRGAAAPNLDGEEPAEPGVDTEEVVMALTSARVPLIGIVLVWIFYAGFLMVRPGPAPAPTVPRSAPPRKGIEKKQATRFSGEAISLAKAIGQPSPGADGPRPSPASPGS